MTPTSQNRTTATRRSKAAEALLSRIDKYMRAHGISARVLSLEVFGNEEFIYNLRNGTEPKPSSIQRIENFLDANPNGIKIISSKQRTAAFKPSDRPEIVASTMVVRRDPCFMCETRGDIGCAHQPKYDPVPLMEIMG